MHQEKQIAIDATEALPDLEAYLQNCQSHASKQWSILANELEPRRPTQNLLAMAGLWPGICLYNLLIRLRQASDKKTRTLWVHCITAAGESITSCQKAARMVIAAEKDDTMALLRELENVGHQHWDVYERPDWLLIEIDNDFLVRPVQAKVALEMVQPSASSSTLMQLNMVSRL